MTRLQSIIKVGDTYHPLTIETAIRNGIGICLVGLANHEIKECLLRTLTALQSFGYKVPGKKFVINISPSGKYTSLLDLPIALGILAETGEINDKKLDGTAIVGELKLNGDIVPLRNPKEVIEAAKNAGFTSCILPESLEEQQIKEQDFSVYAVKDLTQIIHLLSEKN